MSSQKTKFGDKEVDKNEFHLSNQAIFLNSVDLSKIVVSSKWKSSDTKYKYFCGHLNNDVIQPLCVILPQMNVDILNILMMVEKICYLLQMMKKFMKSIIKYGK